MANSDDREPWSFWASLPPGSDLAVRVGLVRPMVCPRCDGSGQEPVHAPDGHQIGYLVIDDARDEPPGPTESPVGEADRSSPQEQLYRTAGGFDVTRADLEAVRQEIDRNRRAVIRPHRDPREGWPG